MATVMRNPFGEAIAASADNIFRAMLFKKQMDQREEEFEEQKRARGVDEALRAHAALAPQMQPDTPLQGSPLADVWSDVLGTDVNQNPLFADVLINPTTAQDRLGEAAALYASEELEGEDRDRVLEYLTIGRSLAEAGSAEDMANVQREALSRLQADMSEDPALMQNIGLTLAGQSPMVEVPIPGGGGRTVRLPQNAMQLWIDMSRLAAMRAQTGQEASTEYNRFLREEADNLDEALEEMGFNASRSSLMRVADTFASGDQQAFDQLIEQGFRPEVGSALRSIFLGGAVATRGVTEGYLHSLDPTGEKNFLLDYEVIQQFEAPVEAKEDVWNRFTERVADEAERQGVEVLPFFQQQNMFERLWGMVRSGLGGGRSPAPQEQPGATAENPLSQFPREQVLGAVQQALDQGLITRAQAVHRYGLTPEELRSLSGNP